MGKHLDKIIVIVYNRGMKKLVDILLHMTIWAIGLVLFFQMFNHGAIAESTLGRDSYDKYSKSIIEDGLQYERSGLSDGFCFSKDLDIALYIDWDRDLADYSKAHGATVKGVYIGSDVIYLEDQTLNIITHEISHWVDDYMLRNEIPHGGETEAYLQGSFTSCAHALIFFSTYEGDLFKFE